MKNTMRHPALKSAHVIINVKHASSQRDVMVYIQPQDIFRPERIIAPDGLEVLIGGERRQGIIEERLPTVGPGDRLSFFVRGAKSKSYQLRIEGSSMSEGLIGRSNFDFVKFPNGK